MILCLLLIVLGWALVAKPLKVAPITGPMVMTLAGLFLATAHIWDVTSAARVTHVLAEITLVVVLFSDASRISLRRLFSDYRLPRQMLLIGIPWTLVVGTLVGLILFPELGFWSAMLLAAILAPTDAALGEAVVSSESVPVRIREALSVESGLNDGFALPIVLLIACFAGVAHATKSATGWLAFGFAQIGVGVVAGIVVGYCGALLVGVALRKRWLGEQWQGIASLSLAGIAWASAEGLQGNGFIAAFVGGMVFGDRLKQQANFLFEFFETEGQLLVLATFALFGATLLPQALEQLSWQIIVYAILSLTLVRMLPVIWSLRKQQLGMPTKLFLGWFGPRGLASLLFVLLIAEEAVLPHLPMLLTVVFVTVFFSVLLHGITAGPLALLYGRWYQAQRTPEGDVTTTPSESPINPGMERDRL